MERIALVIGDAGMRSRIAASLVLEGVDVMIAASLDNVREGTPTVTDHPSATGSLASRASGDTALCAIAIVRNPAGGVRIDTCRAIAGNAARDIVRATNELLAVGRDGSPRQGSLQQSGLERDP